MKVPLTTTIAPRLTREQRQFVRSLEVEFGVPFSTWIGLGRTAVACVHGDGRDIRAELESLLPSIDNCDAPLTRPLASGKTLLIVPMVAGYGDQAAAIAELPDAPSERVNRHATLFLEAEKLRRNNRQLTDVNDSLTHAVAGCYEELLFLRDLGVHLSLATSSADTVRELLPKLCSTLRVQSVAMISKFPAVRSPDSEPPQPEVLWADEALLEDRRCLKLLGEFIARDDADLAIQNDFKLHSLAPDFPEVREFLLVRIGQAAEGRWLLAVNRILDERAKQRRYRASEKELGTNEATLLTSAAAFLATHFQNVEVLRQKDALLQKHARALARALEAHDSSAVESSDRVAL